ncbi:MAG TPA: CHAT domain-containing protein [Bryobacteraceae bacterium]|nr:CHAT domain-containing protein [Bryobacteraceae bacterium]
MLPSRPQLTSAVRDFRDALLAGRDATESGRKLFSKLFGKLSSRVHACRDWVLVLDDVLFEIPFGALPDGNQYAVERHTFRTRPSGFMQGDSAPAERHNAFLAVADPVYNAADPRGRRRAPAASALAAQAAPIAAQLELARIPASSIEARRCAREWNLGAATVLTGPEVTRARLEAELRRRPASLHLAVHIVSSADSERALIGLGLDESGQPDFLDALEISRKRYGVPMVVLSGCSSGRGRAVSGAGLTGLTRAWLLSGSRTVIASHWPTADDTGELFTAFYHAVGRLPEPLSARSCARALRAAQLEMLNSGSWRAQPRYWAAFFVSGRD